PGSPYHRLLELIGAHRAAAYARLTGEDDQTSRPRRTRASSVPPLRAASLSAPRRRSCVDRPEPTTDNMTEPSCDILTGGVSASLGPRGRPRHAAGDVTDPAIRWVSAQEEDSPRRGMDAAGRAETQLSQHVVAPAAHFPVDRHGAAVVVGHVEQRHTVEESLLRDEDVFASRPDGERAVPVGSPAVHVRLGVEGTGHVVAGVHVEDSPHPGYRPRLVAYCPVAQPELPGFVVAP